MRQLAMNSDLITRVDAAGAAARIREGRTSNRDLQPYRQPPDCGEKCLVVACLVANSADHIRFARARGLPEPHVDGLEEQVELVR